jgi:hypothetical protein
MEEIFFFFLFGAGVGLVAFVVWTLTTPRY